MIVREVSRVRDGKSCIRLINYGYDEAFSEYTKLVYSRDNYGTLEQISLLSNKNKLLHFRRFKYYRLQF